MPKKQREQATAVANSAQDLSRLLKSAKFRDVMDEFYDDPDARKAASKNTAGYLKRRGVTIPKGMKITLTDNNWNVEMCLHIIAGIKFCIKIDSTSGFGPA
jgi:hypothetical protein